MLEVGDGLVKLAIEDREDRPAARAVYRTTRNEKLANIIAVDFLDLAEHTVKVLDDGKLNGSTRQK